MLGAAGLLGAVLAAGPATTVCSPIGPETRGPREVAGGGSRSLDDAYLMLLRRQADDRRISHLMWHRVGPR